MRKLKTTVMKWLAQSWEKVTSLAQNYSPTYEKAREKPQDS